MSGVKGFFVGVVATALVIGGLYSAGFRVSGPGEATVAQPGANPAVAGQGRGQPGWRKAQQQAAGNQVAAPQPGSAAGARRAALTNPSGGPGSGAGQGAGRQARGPGARNNQPKGEAAQAGRPGAQPGFGPSGGILLPLHAGTSPVPVLVNGKEKGKFVGKDLIDHVEDTVIATAAGPRKGWGVGKTLTYLGIKNAQEVALYDQAGKKVTVTGQQIKDDKTFVLLTYDEKGTLLLASGPKVRGTNKGNTSREQVLDMVKGRSDLLAVPNVVKIEVKS